MTNVFIVGAGRMGTALAQSISGNVGKVCIWDRKSEVVDSILRNRKNPLSFPETRLADNIMATTELSEVRDSDIVFFAVPSHAVREVAMRLESFHLDDKILVSLAKGVEYPPTRRMSEILYEVFGNRAAITVMSGPNFADEIVAGQFTVTTIAASDSSILERVRDVLWTDTFSVQTSHDLKGVELCGILKNVYSIAMGICDAMDLGKNAYYCVLNQAYNEMKDLVLCSGGNLETMFLSCGLGDFVLTANSDKSRNRTVGLLYGKGLMNTEVGKGAVQEGKKSIMAAMEICSSRSVKSPVTEFVHDVVWKREGPNEAFRKLWPRMQGGA